MTAAHPTPPVICAPDAHDFYTVGYEGELPQFVQCESCGTRFRLTAEIVVPPEGTTKEKGPFD